MLDSLKNYLRIDFDDDDEFLLLLIEVAKEFIINAVGVYEDTPTYKLLSYAIVSDLYEKRSYTIEKDSKLNKIIKSLVFQLQLNQDKEGD